MMDASAEPSTEPTAFPKIATTAFPSNGQLLAEETEELLAAGLSAMKADLAERPAWSGAPSPPTDEFLLMFLRTEVFSPSAAADRYRKFWKVKVSLCGEEKAAFPLKVEDTKAGVSMRYMQLVPGSRDIEGRQVVLVTPGNMDKSVDRKIRVLGVWYVLLAGLEDVETQRRGFCFVVATNTFKFGQVDTKFTRMAMESVQGALPLRIGSINICHPPTFFRMVWAVVSAFLHERVKKRVRVLTGTDAEVQNALAYIVAPEDMPLPVGQKALDFPAWLAECTRNESQS